MRLTVGLLLVTLLAGTSCRPTQEQAPVAEADVSSEGEPVIAQIGDQTITVRDVDYHLQERFAGRADDQTRELALQELIDRARMAQAALDAGLDQESLVRAEYGRVLAGQTRERFLNPQLKTARESIPESRLRELYADQASRFVSREQRRMAVLWLNPGADPERQEQYRQKLGQAREWCLKESDLKDHPEKGFSVLSVDHSEHRASRFKGGDVGWMEREGGFTGWSRTVAEAGFSLKATGEVSEVIANEEGLFLVRLTGVEPALQRSFESVRAQLEREEQARVREQIETDFRTELEQKYPAR
jgi:hypothetical protein